MAVHVARREKQLGALETRLSSWLWSSRTTRGLQDARPPPTPPTPTRTSTLRLAPLSMRDTEFRASELPAVPSPARPTSGHLGVMQGLRRSAPSEVPDLWLRASRETAVSTQGPWQHMAALAADSVGCLSSSNDSLEPKRTLPEVRVRRMRDLRRGRSCTSSLGEAGLRVKTASSFGVAGGHAAARSCVDVVAPTAGTRPILKRCDSVPATGTSKADEEAAAVAKTRAIESLHRFFSEEMAKGDQDPSGAAASALLRLGAVPRSAGRL
eukprot:TRINITY_DN7785_c0_g1_i1.p1 TRINITY_DN7785_c0_g1~~TRINITY_DN7785_c0_g1_i1.p1  ORF type:complete len:268 (-),score=37.65 TRINITY_DN7785_c0_g1_i1:740-1543(-)